MGGIERSLKYGFIRNAEIRFHTFSLYLYHLLSLSLSLSRFSLSLITSRSHFLAPYRFSTSQGRDRKFTEPPPLREHITTGLSVSISLSHSQLHGLTLRSESTSLNSFPRRLIHFPSPICALFLFSASSSEEALDCCAARRFGCRVWYCVRSRQTAS